MFFSAHAYYSLQKSNNVAVPARIFGALLADSALTGVINWTSLHDKSTIQAFAKKLPQDEAQLGLGLMDHYELDQKSHETYGNGIGYAFSHQTLELRELVSQACKFTSTEQARGLAHNFIESGVDINLLRNDNSIQYTMRQNLERVDVNRIAEHMASFFKTDVAETKSHLATYRNLITKYNLEEVDDWTSLWSEMVFLLLGTTPYEQTIKEALLLAIELTAKDYTQVLAVSN